MNELQKEILEKMVELIIIRQLLKEGEFKMVVDYIKYKEANPD